MTSKKLPDSVNLDSYFSGVHVDIPSTVPFLSSFLQYTVFHCTTSTVIQTTYSSNIIVTDASFKGNISRELIYHLTQSRHSE